MNHGKTFICHTFRTLFRPLLVAAVLLLSLPTTTVQASSDTGISRQPGATCQLAAGVLYNEALETLRGLRAGKILLDFLNPAKRLDPRKAKKSKAYKAVTRLLLAVAVVGSVACPPIVMPAPFRGLSRDSRVDKALEIGFDPADPDIELLVRDPDDPNSCTRTLNQDFNTATGEILDFGSFQEMQFVYAEPFGSFPSASKFLKQILEERVRELMNTIASWLPDDVLPEIPLDDIDEFIDGFVELPSYLNPRVGDIPYLKDVIELMISGINSSLNLEEDFYSNFNGWKTELGDLPSERVTREVASTGGYELEFRDGLSQWFVIADHDLTPTGFAYTQRVFIRERFKPYFNVLYEIEDPDNPGTMLKIVADAEYEALEPGRADRSYTPPTSFQGTLGASDNCDPDPEERVRVPAELSLGIHYFPITAVDRSGNESDLYHVRVNVVDTIPPDVNPPGAIGIEVAAGTSQVNFTDPGIGCTTYLCQNSLTDRQVYPPTYFDFATITPEYDCFASNTLGMDQPCDLASLPVGEATEVRWEATDPSGNVETILQHVAIREAGTNQPPVAEGTSVTVAAGITTPIPLRASDPEFDPLTWMVNSQPANGQLEIDPEPQFQTRFSLSGTMERMSSIVKLDGQTANRAWNRILIADEGNRRLIEVDSVGSGNEPTIYFAHFLGNVRPSSILFYDFDNSAALVTNERYMEELLIADWSTGRIHTLLGPDNSPDPGYDISQWVSNPAQIAILFDGSDARLFVTDPDPVGSTNGKLVILRISNFDPANPTPANTWAVAHEATIDMNAELAGFNPDAITATSCNTLLLADSDGDGGGAQGRMATYFYLGSGAGNSGIDRTWDISSLTVDPPGDARPLLGTRIEMASGPTNCSNFSVWVADDASKEVVPVDLNSDSSVTAGTPLRVGTEFVTILNLEAPSADKFYVQNADRLARYDINGVMDMLILIKFQTENYHNFNQLFPEGDLFIDMDLTPSGDLLLLDYGDNASSYPAVHRITPAPGFNQFTNRVEGAILNQYLSTAYALSYNPGSTSASGDDRVLIAGSEALVSQGADLGWQNMELLLDQNPSGNSCAWCNVAGFGNSQWEKILDVASDAQGNVYLSDALNRVHKFTSTGSYIGWLGRCDSGADCDTANGHSNGFSCRLNTCDVANTAGRGTSQFDFMGNSAGALFEIESRRPRYGRLTVDDQAGLLYVSDIPDYDADPNTPRLPRIQSFSLATGNFNDETIPDGEPGKLLSFLDPGDFTAVNDMAVFDDGFFVAEDLPLQRLHVFEASAFSATLDGATVNYIADNYSGPDLFEYSVEDSFGAASNLAQVNITVVQDNEPPQLDCPADITIEGTHPGGARPSQFVQGEAGSVELSNFLEGYTLSDNVDVPEATASHDAPALFPLGTTTVTFTATDAVGNNSQCQANVTVVDTVAPELAEGASVETIRIEASAEMTPYNPPQPAFEERVGPLTVSLSPAGPYPLGTTRLVWTASDGAGNQARVLQRLVVEDTTAPLWGFQPPYPDQEAVNGHSNPVAYTLPGVYEAVGLAQDVACMPAPNALAASVEVEVNCHAMDTSRNFSKLRFNINIVQSDDDGDGISNIVDTRPAQNDGSGEFSDLPLGGNTHGRVLDDSGFEVRVEDAWFEPQGVRIEVSPLVLMRAQTPPGAKLQGAASGEAVEISACDDRIHISGLVDGVDADNDPAPGVAIVSCQPLEVIAESGSLNLTLPGPNGEQAHIHLDSGNGISWDGYNYIAPDGNNRMVVVTTPSGLLNVQPGSQVPGSRIYGIPAINIWGMLGLLILLGGIAAQELRRRQRV